MITPLYPIFQKRIDDAFDDLVKKQIEPWAMLNCGKPMRVMTFNNKQISYEGICFEGSPEKVFWSRYIEPFMEEIDRRLKGKGFPEKIPLRSIDVQLDEMKNFIDLRARAEQELWHRSRFERWFKQNSFWVWVFGAIGAVVAIYAKSK